MLEIGNIVVSLKGHDKGRTYVVLSIDGEFAFLVDGKYRLLSHPKKKRIKHLKNTFESIDLGKKELFDYQIITVLKKYDNMHKN